MGPLSANQIESELSYAYLHAVAAIAGVACSVATRHEDNAGIDARLTGWGPFPAGSRRQEVDIAVQVQRFDKSGLSHLMSEIANDRVPAYRDPEVSP